MIRVARKGKTPAGSSKTGTAWVNVTSSNITAYRYAVDTHDLDVRFTSGSAYRYSNVPPSVVTAFAIAPSKGTYLARHIKSIFPAYKLDGSDG